MKRRGLRYLSAALVCATLGSCLSPPKIDPPVNTPPATEEKLDPILEDRLIEILNFWTLLVDKAWDPHPAAGAIRNKDGDLVGSGVLISPTHVLTAAHVADYAGDIFFSEYDLDSTKVKCIDYYPEYLQDGEYVHDIAVLTLDTPSDEQPISSFFGDSSSDTSQEFLPVRIIGYSFDIRKVSKKNVFKYFGRTQEKPQIIVMLPMNATIWNGDSGCPMITEDGKLLGIITHYRITRDGTVLMNGAASVEYYSEWIRGIIDPEIIDPV